MNASLLTAVQSQLAPAVTATESLPPLAPKFLLDGLIENEQHWRNRIDTLFESQFAAARSCLPSPSKSPTTPPKELRPTLKLVAEPNPPAPSPNRIDTFEEPKFGTARSCLPSPLKSPTAIVVVGLAPTPKLPG